MRIGQSSKVVIFLGALFAIAGCGGSGDSGPSSTGSIIPPQFSNAINGLQFTSANHAHVKENQKIAIDVDANTAKGKALKYSIYGTDVDSFDINETTGLVTFKEAPDYENDGGKTAYFFTVKVDDTNAELSQDINITIININDEKPIITSSETKIVEEKQTKAMTVEASDADKDTLTYTISGTDASSFKIVPTTGVVTFKKAPAYTPNKQYKFIATVSDGKHKTSKEVTVTIRDPKVNNKKPIITSSATAEVEENQKSAIDVKATDADAHTLTYSISGTDVDSFIIDKETGVVTFNEAPDYETKNKYTFTVKVSDGIEEVEQAIAITIKNVIDTAPKITSSDKAIVPEGQTTAMTVTATDADEGDVLTYSISGTDAGSLSIDATTGKVTFNTAADYETKKEYKFTVKVSDTGGLSVTQDITITISNVNDGAPKIDSPSTASVKENQTSAITVTATDPDGDTLTYEISDNNNNFTISQTGVVTFNQEPDYESGKTSYNFTVKVSDGEHNATQAITITILDDESDNDTTAPDISIIGANPIELTLGQDYTDAGATAKDDVDGDVEVTSSSTVDTEKVGTYTITYMATDLAGNEATEERTVTVTEAPDTTPPVITLNGEESIELTVGDTYTEEGATATDNVDTTVIVTPSGAVDTATAGTYTINYTATDAAENTATATRTVTVTAAADTTAPVITITGTNPMTLAVGEEYTEEGATATDEVDGTVDVTTSGAVETDTAGTYTINYTATDAAENEATATRTVTVTAAADTTAPVITITGTNPMTLAVGEEYTEEGATATDEVDGTVDVTTSGTVETDTAGTYTINYTATDAAENEATATRTVTVTE